MTLLPRMGMYRIYLHVKMMVNKRRRERERGGMGRFIQSKRLLVVSMHEIGECGIMGTGWVKELDTIE
jgi:hypothetical protein